MVTEYTRAVATGVLSDSGNSISATNAGEPFGLAVSPDGAQLYVLSEAYESIKDSETHPVMNRNSQVAHFC